VVFLAATACALGLAASPDIAIGIDLADAFPDGSYVTAHLALVGNIWADMPSELFIVADKPDLASAR
jgi:hypothetical protein